MTLLYTLKLSSTESVFRSYTKAIESWPQWVAPIILVFGRLKWEDGYTANTVSNL